MHNFHMLGVTAICLLAETGMNLDPIANHSCAARTTLGRPWHLRYGCSRSAQPGNLR